MKAWGELPEWQRERAERLDAICREIEGTPKRGRLAVMERAIEQYSGGRLANGARDPKVLRLSGPTLRRALSQWRNNGRTAQAFELGYTTTSRREVPRDLIFEWQKRLTTPGTTHAGHKSAATVYKQLKEDWKAGFSIAGLGTWQEWSQAQQRPQPGTLTPPNGCAGDSVHDTRAGSARYTGRIPEFPFSYEAMLRYRPDVATAALGNLGIAAARDALSRLTRDSSGLRLCEVYVLDDVKADLVVLDDWSGSLRLIEPTMYFMMEVGCRFIAGFVTRGTDAILQADVDALIAHVLGDMGIGNGYPTHILFERGMVACSEARQRFLEGMFPGRIFIHRTGMNGGAAYPGAYVDKASGKPCSKGMIEAFMRKLHLRLSALPGQTGSNQRVNGTSAPAEMDARKREAETLAAIEQRTGMKLETPVLRLSQFAELVRLAISDYNDDPDHGCQGFHQQLQMETAPGVWEDVPTIQPEEIARP
jgi:hypothetical protein